MAKKMAKLFIILILIMQTTIYVDGGTVNAAPNYVLAGDEDFEVSRNVASLQIKYIGKDEYVEIPHTITDTEGIEGPINMSSYSSYSSLFINSSVKGVKSTNQHIYNMNQMFEGNKAVSLDLSAFDTSSATHMYQMFANSKATELNLSGFDTSNVMNMNGMFLGSQATTLDLSSFDTSKVTGMNRMFSGSQATTLDLSSFDTSKVTNIASMFLDSEATVGYARTQADADRFNNSSGKPNGLNFVSVEILTNFSTNGDTTYKQEHGTMVDVTGYDTEEPLQYAWTTSTNTPSSGWVSFASGDTISKNNDSGNFYLHVRGTDWFGDTITATSEVFKFDNTGPTMSVSMNPNGYTNGNVTVTVTGTDEHSGIRRIRRGDTNLSINSSSATFEIATNGTYEFLVEDYAGNTTTQSISISNIDKTPPSSPTINAPASWQKNDVAVAIRVEIDGGSGVERTEYRINGGDWLAYTEEFVITKNGETLVEARTIDKATNESTIASLTVKLDKESPSLMLTQNDTNLTNGDVAITARASDDHSGVRRIRMAEGDWIEGDEMMYTVTENGSYTFEVEDHAGNMTLETIIIENIDKTAPAKPIITAPTTWQNEDISVLILDGMLGEPIEDMTEYRINGGDWMTYAGTFVITENGETLIEARKVDKATNESDIARLMIGIDKKGPSLMLTQNNTNLTNGDVVITARASDDVSGVVGIRTADGGWVNVQERMFTFSENGSYTFEAMDGAGNITLETIRITNIDKTSPTLELLGSEILTLEIGDTYDEKGATAEDNVDGDISDKIKITGAVDTGKLGSYQIHYNVIDSAGNKASEVTREVHVIAPETILLILGKPAVPVYPGSLVDIKGTEASIQLPNDLPLGTTLQVDVVTLPVEGYERAGEIYDFNFTYPKGFEDYQGNFVLTLGVDETKDNAAIYHYNEGEKMWEFIGGKLADGQISVPVYHFSTYGVLSKKTKVDIIEPVVKKVKESTSLPKTATNIYNLLTIGFLFIIAGIICWYVGRRLKVVK